MSTQNAINNLLATTSLTGYIQATNWPAQLGDVTNTAGSYTNVIGNKKVTYAKIQDVTAVSLLGNPTGGALAPSEITLGAGLSFSGTTLVATGSGGTVTNVTFTGDGTILSSTPSSAVTTTGTLTATMANAPAKSLLGNGTAGATTPTYETSPTISGTMTADQFVSTVAIGTAPFTVTSTTPVANLSIGGNAATATSATNAVNSGITNDTSTNATMYPVWVTANTGNLPLKVSSTKITFNPSTGILTSTGLIATGTIETGANAGTNGSLKLYGSTSGDATIKTAAAAGTATIFQLPATNGTNTYVLQTDGFGVTSWVAPSSAFMPMPTIVVTGSTQAMAINTYYVSNNGGLCTMTLPAVAVLGTEIMIGGLGAGGWLLAQNAGQLINFGNVVTTTGVGGSIASQNQFDNLHIKCIVANTTWNVIAAQGNMTCT